MRKLLLLIVALAAMAVAPTSAMAASNEGVTAAYPPQPPRNIQLRVGVVCHENVPHVDYLAQLIGFAPVGSPSLLLTYGTTEQPVTISGLQGQINYPEAAYATGLTVTILLDGVKAAAQVLPLATECGDVSPPRSLDVTAFAPVCVNDVPYISYDIKTIGFTPSGGATLTFYDKNGKQVSVVQVNSLSGQVLYPGAAVDATGHGIDWPGWKKTNIGEWVIDDSDAILREGLTVKVDVEAPTADQAVSSDAQPAGFRTVLAQATTTLSAQGSVDYPDATPQCAGPQQAVPSSPAGQLPRTGSSVTTMLQVGAGALLAGLLVFVAARRRHVASTAG